MDENQLATHLVRRCLTGDSAAWETLVRSHHRRIYSLCYRFTGSGADAEDLTQEVFIRVYRNLPSYQAERGSFTTWITTMTRNLLVDHFRRTKTDRVTESLDAVPAGDESAPSAAELLEAGNLSPHTLVESKETQRLVQLALQKLSPELREAVILRDLQEMEYREIAQVLRVPEGTVKSRINRGRTELARLLARIHR